MVMVAQAGRLKFKGVPSFGTARGVRSGAMPARVGRR